MNRLFEERNKTIVRRFDALYGTMPTMVLYARIGQDFGLSEETVRKIVRKTPQLERRYFRASVNQRQHSFGGTYAVGEV